MLKAEPITALWFPLTILLVMAVVVLGGAVLRFRRDLAPSSRRDLVEEPELQATTS
jgi:ABC-2 type transport system permease protein